MNPKDILPKNEEGNWHGYCEQYWNNSGDLMWKGVRVNGLRYGCHEEYNGGVYEYETGYFLGGIKVSVDNKEGYCFIWCKVIV